MTRQEFPWVIVSHEAVDSFLLHQLIPIDPLEHSCTRAMLVVRSPRFITGLYQLVQFRKG